MFGVQLCARQSCSRVTCTRTHYLHTPHKAPRHHSGVRLYSRSSDVEKARQFLDKYHKKTIKKYGDVLKGGNQLPQEHNPSQFRAQPEFLKNARHCNSRAYFCKTVEGGEQELVRYKRTATSQQEQVLAEHLDSACLVKEVAPSRAREPAATGLSIGTASGEACGIEAIGNVGAHLAILVSSDSFSAIYIIDERTGGLLTTLNSGHQLQWISDRELFYTTINGSMRPDCAYFLDLNNLKPELCYQSHAKDEVVSVSCTKDAKYTSVNINTKLASQVYLLDNRRREVVCNEGNNVCLIKQGIKCYIEHLNDRVIALMSSHDDPNLSLHWLDLEPGGTRSTADISAGPLNAVHFTKHPGGLGVIHEMEVFERGVVLYNARSDGKSRGCHILTLLDPTDLTLTKATLPLPDDVSFVTPNNNLHTSQTHLNVLVNSYTKPTKQLSIPFTKFGVSRGKLISRGKYGVVRSSAQSAGTTVPITIIGKESVLRTSSPCLFVVYGCYGENLDFTYEMLPAEILDRGWKVVLCHVRGGSEVGRAWYLQGAGANKQNAILDTMNCIKHVYSCSLAVPHTSTLQSYSAGALVAASVAQAVPGITRKLVLQMPFLDLQTAMSDSDQPLSSEEVEEWSDPADFAASIEKLCPCNSSNALKSEVYVTTALRDRRAPCWHTANFLSSIFFRNKGQVFVNLLRSGDHGSFDEEASRLETRFIEDQSRSIWERVRSKLY